MKKTFNFVVFLLITLSTLTSYCFADATSPANPTGAFGGLLPIIIIFVFFYLFLLRPQQKKAKEHQNTLNNLKKDDRVITAGGIYATVINVRENIVEAKIADGVNIQIAKQSISEVIKPKTQEDAQIPEIVKK